MNSKHNMHFFASAFPNLIKSGCFWCVLFLMANCDSFTQSMGNAVYSFLSFPVVFMGTPALSVFLTRKIAGDKSAIAYNTKVWKNKKAPCFLCLFLLLLSLRELFYST